MGIKADNKNDGLRKGCIPEDLKKVLRSVWGDKIDDDKEKAILQVVPLSGAMTNEVFRIKWANNKNSPTVLVRVYGDGVDLFFKRDDEIETFQCLSELRQGPRLVGLFSGGRVEEFIHARTLSASDLRDPETSSLIASKMREFHRLEMPGARKALLWTRMRKWHKEAKRLCSDRDVKKFSLEEVGIEIKRLEKELSLENQEIGFCHNDLQYGNIMMDEETRSITLIDYEYASYNPVAYDIANHFCEMAANYHSDTPHILDYSKYPGLEERRRFVRAYLNSGDTEASDSAVEKLLEGAENYSLANHLFWGLWGIMSSYVNNIDFDYSSYARQRFDQYNKKAQDLGFFRQSL